MPANANPSPTNDQRTTLSDEEEAIRSLDDTVMRPLPNDTSLWEAVEQSRQPYQTPAEPPRPRRMRTVALVGAIAATSFVAGGVFARLSSQIPMLFAQRQEATEKVAAYTTQTPTVTPELTQEEDEPESSPTPPSYDTGYDSDTYDRNTTDDYQSPTDTTDDTSLQINLDEDGNQTITYDYDSDLVTLDYEGYSLTVPLGELMGYDSPSTSTPSYPYGDSTGYDSEEERDYYSWSRPRGSYNWRGTYTT